MKIGDLVKWNGRADRTGVRPDTGIVVDGPRVGFLTLPTRTTTYQIAWGDAKESFWHNDYNLEVLSESR